MSKVVKLKVVKKKKPASNGIAVERLRSVMSRVKSGDVTDVFVVGIKPDGGMVRAWSDGPGLKVFTMLGAIEDAKSEFMKNSIGDAH